MKATIKEDRTLIDVSMDEAVLLHNALGAICHGPYAIEDWEFHALIGSTKHEAESLLKQLGNVIDALKKNQGDK